MAYPDIRTLTGIILQEMQVFDLLFVSSGINVIGIYTVTESVVRCCIPINSPKFNNGNWKIQKGGVTLRHFVLQPTFQQKVRDFYESFSILPLYTR